MTHNYSNLQIWKRSRVFVKNVYSVIHTLPLDEKYGLSSQIKRCAVSVPSNIAEGCGRGTNKQLSHFLNYSIGSLCELETQLLLAVDLDFLSNNDINPLIEELIVIRKMIIGFQKTLK